MLIQRRCLHLPSIHPSHQVMKCWEQNLCRQMSLKITVLKLVVEHQKQTHLPKLHHMKSLLIPFPLIQLQIGFLHQIVYLLQTESLLQIKFHLLGKKAVRHLREDQLWLPLQMKFDFLMAMNLDLSTGWHLLSAPSSASATP